MPTPAQIEKLYHIHELLRHAHDALMKQDLSSIQGIGKMREKLTEAMNEVEHAIE
jgi:vacuolar-type H+-ATPase subunit D/Vma8